MPSMWPARQSIRLREHNYGAKAGYFVTLCASERACLFGKIHGGELSLSAVGTIVDEEWRRTADLRTNVILDTYVVMPNHFHAIIFITRPSSPELKTEPDDRRPSAKREWSSDDRARASQQLAPTMSPRAGSLGTILGQFKAAVTKRVVTLADGPNVVWQRNYYEHVIRDDADLNRIRKYITDNPANWPEDPENPANLPEHRPLS
jgi:putative transposase